MSKENEITQTISDEDFRADLAEELKNLIEDSQIRDRSSVLLLAQALNTIKSHETGEKPLNENVLKELVNYVLKSCRPNYIDAKGFVVPSLFGEHLMNQKPCYCRNGMLFQYDSQEGYYRRVKDRELSRMFYNACENPKNILAGKAKEFRDTFFDNFDDEKKSYDEKSYIACGNGVYSLESNTIVPYSDEYRLECKFKPIYDESISEDEFRQSTFYKFLSDSVPDKQTQETIQEMIGLCLSPHAKEVQKCFFLQGDGSNGKSVLIDIIRALFAHDDESVCGVPFSRIGARFGLDNVKASFVNIVSDDLCRDMDKKSDIFKRFVTGEPVTVEEKYKGATDTCFNVTSIYGMNELPETLDRTFGYERRPCIIPFKVRFGDPEEIEAGTADKLKDRTLINKIVDNPRELELVFWWAIQGLKRLKANGWKLTESGESKAVKNEYIREINTAEAFFQDCIIRDPEANRISYQSVYAQYERFCEDVLRTTPLEFKDFNKHLKSKRIKGTRGKTGMYWGQIRIRERSDVARAFDEATQIEDDYR